MAGAAIPWVLGRADRAAASHDGDAEGSTGAEKGKSHATLPPRWRGLGAATSQMIRGAPLEVC